METFVLHNLIGKRVVVFYASLDQRSFKYEGILKSIDEQVVVVDDMREGILVLPFKGCQIKAGAIDG